MTAVARSALAIVVIAAGMLAAFLTYFPIHQTSTMSLRVRWSPAIQRPEHMWTEPGDGQNGVTIQFVDDPARYGILVSPHLELDELFRQNPQGPVVVETTVTRQFGCVTFFNPVAVVVGNRRAEAVVLANYWMEAPAGIHPGRLFGPEPFWCS